MCETMTSIPSVEDNVSYVLTEDMIDAAMTEQYAFQDDIESEEELSPNNNMDVDVEARVTLMPDGHKLSSSPSNGAQGQHSSNTKQPPEESSRNVVVIETGLDKINERLNEQNYANSLSSSDTIHHNGNAAEEITITDLLNSAPNKPSTSYITNPDGENCNGRITKEYKVPILKSILKRSDDKDLIDLCNSDTDDNSEEEFTEVEMVDNELQAVMESNLMAEVGLDANSKTVGQFSKSPSIVTTPKLQVKSVTCISPSAFNNMSQINKPSDTELPTTSNGNEVNPKLEENKIFKDFRLPNFVVKSKDHSIHLNKIAVPNQAVFNNKGMKYFYIKNTSGAPVVINSSQQPSTSKNIKFMMTQQVKKPTRLSPTGLFPTMQKRQLHINQPVVSNGQLTLPSRPLVFPANQSFLTNNQSNSSESHEAVTSNNQLSLLNYQSIQSTPNGVSAAPRTVGTPSQRAANVPPFLQLDEEVVGVIKSLLFQGVKRPYIPPEMARSTTLFQCIDCHDRFIIQSSLTNHLDRHSLLIRYWCQACVLELQFFNRCVFLGHLRNHKFPVSQLDFSKISVSPLPIEMIQDGAVSKFLKECTSDLSSPPEECIITRPNRDMSDAVKQSNNSNNTSVTTYGNNISSNQSTAPSTSQSTNIQSSVSLLLNKNNTPRFTMASSPREVPLMAATLTNNPALPAVQHSRIHSKETSAHNTKTAPKKHILVLDKSTYKPMKVKQNVKISVLPPNELFSVSDNMIINNDSLEQPVFSLEEEVRGTESVKATISSYSSRSSPSTSNSKNTSKNTVKQIRHSGLPKSLPEKLLKRVCTECGNSCLNISNHLNGCGRPTHRNLVCNRCDLVLPTRCALKCHSRIHQKTPPYKCPDCGKDFKYWNDLYSHLKTTCGHFAKCVQYRCTSCKENFPLKSSLASHISIQHSRDIFRCSSCPIAYYNKTALDNHMITTDHKGENVTCSIQKQCNMCPKRLFPQDEFESHVEYHTNNNSALIYCYRCPVCQVVYENKTAFIIHYVKELERLKSATFTSNVVSQDNEVLIHESDQKETSHSHFEFVEQPVANFEVNSPSHLPPSEKDPLSSDDWELLQEQGVNDNISEVCVVCKKNPVIILTGVNINQQSLCCKQCVKTLDDHSTVQNGMTTMKKSSFIMDKKATTSSSMNYKETKQSFKNGSPTVGKRSHSVGKSPFRPKKQRKSGVTFDRVIPDTKSYMNFQSDFPVPVKKSDRKVKERARTDFEHHSSHSQGKIITYQSPNDLVCAKCKFVGDTKETFLEHITVHRMDPNTYQCLECGLCFVVLPSLERHLRMHHDIRDVNDYTDKNKASLPKKIYVEESQFLQENQCRVCLEIYDSNSSLEKHFRTHGMAFMSSLIKST